MHEAQMWPRNCFITLTYGRGNLPPYGSLEHNDFKQFIRRTVKHFKLPVRYYMCGEYGPLNKRPHYHACLFNIDFDDRKAEGTSNSGEIFYHSATLEKLWGLGERVSVQNLTKETAGYCARYIMKKQLGQSAKSAYVYTTEDGEIIPIKPEYAQMSLRPGIGAEWYKKYGTDVYPHDRVIANGAKHQVPKYYDKLLKRSKQVGRSGEFLREEMGFKRAHKAREHTKDNTDARLAIIEQVHAARIETLARSNDL